MGLIAIEEALHVPLLDIFPTKNNRIEKALQCAPLLGTESPLPRLACSHLLEKSQLRHLSNSPTCIRHCQPICRVSQGKCQKLIDDLRTEYFTLSPFLCQMSFYSFRSPRHPSFPTCTLTAWPCCTSTWRLLSAAREASYALSR